MKGKGQPHGEDENVDQPQRYERCCSLASDLHLIKTTKDIVRDIHKYDNSGSEVVSHSCQDEAGFLASLN